MQTNQSKLLALSVVGILVLVGFLMSSRQAPVQAAGSAPVTIVGPLPLPVTGDTSVSGTVAATQSGTWQVEVTNTPPQVAPITQGGQAFFLNGGQHNVQIVAVTASALSITFQNGARDLILYNQDHIVARFPGRGNDAINLALTRPITFDGLSCFGESTSICWIGWVGNLP